MWDYGQQLIVALQMMSMMSPIVIHLIQSVGFLHLAAGSILEEKMCSCCCRGNLVCRFLVDVPHARNPDMMLVLLTASAQALFKRPQNVAHEIRLPGEVLIRSLQADQ